jgi:transposase-like protein
MLQLQNKANSKPVCSECRSSVVKFGVYKRQSDQKKVQRFKCLHCKISFSEATADACFFQKKRHLNQMIFKLLVGGFSQRRIAMDLQVNRKTVIRKFLFLGLCATHLIREKNLLHPKTQIVEFDDLETFEHSKCKPLSVTLAVEHSSRRILGYRVSQMPAKGKLARLSRMKYGPRKDERPQARNELFDEIKPLIEITSLIKSDMNPHYVLDVQKHFPEAKHYQYKGRRGCVVGQGELKRGGHDPLFSLNHTCAMLRANINRLVRRTWCTTKIKERLSLHIAMYVLNHNELLIHNKAR